jgi:hypothetical protein
MRLVAGDCELIVGVSAGPRILGLHWRGGPNLLYEDRTDFRVGAWRLYGGHRLTIAPENPLSYEPEIGPCAWEPRGDVLVVNSPPRGDGLELSLEVRPATAGDGFELLHRGLNASGQEWRGALWALTCVPRPSRVIAPFRHTPSAVRYWDETSRQSLTWRHPPGFILTDPTQDRVKAGWHDDRAWLASLQSTATLVVQVPDPPSQNDCVDGGCNLEVFCGPEYLELETLGPDVRLPPGEETTHLQHWHVVASAPQESDWSELARRFSGPPIDPLVSVPTLQ